MDTSIDMRFLLLLVIFLEKNAYAGPTSYKRKLLYHNGNYDWDDSVNFCLQRDGYLVNVDTAVVKNAIDHFQQTAWRTKWGNDVWIGLYIDSITASEVTMRMQGRQCPVYDYMNLYGPWDPEVPPTIDANKKCTLLKASSFTWTLEKCSFEISFICEIYRGECTFELEHGNKCATSYSTGLKQEGTASITECYSYCKQLSSDGTECWAVTYDEDDKVCYPSMGTRPFDYESSTSNCGSLQSPKFSHKRCFEASHNYGIVAPINNNQPLEPLPVCSFIQYTISKTEGFASDVVSTLIASEGTTTIGETTRTSTTAIAREDITSADTTEDTTSIVRTTTGNDTPTVDTTAGITTSRTIKNTTTMSTNYSECTCACSFVSYDAAVLESLMEKMISDLKIEAKNTSSAKRKKISVRDMSLPNNVIGSVVCFVLMGSLVLFLSSDLIRVFSWCKYMFCK